MGSAHNTPGPSIISGTRRLFAIGQAVVDAAIAGEMCGVCLGTGGDHSARCLVAEHLAHDSVTRRRLMAAGEEEDRG